MIKENLLQKLDTSKLKNFKLLDKQFLNLEYDKDNQYSLPYTIGTTGIMVNTDYIKEPIESWQDLWNEKYKNKVLLLDDVRDVFHIALLLEKFSPNTVKEEEIKRAYNRLLSLLPNVAAFNSDAPENPYLQGEADIGMVWNNSAYRAVKNNPALKFIVPKEGLLLWIDTIAIPKNTKNLDEVYAFIDFLLRPDIAKQIMLDTGISFPVKDAIVSLPDNVKNSKILFPKKEDFEKGQLQKDIGDATTIYSKYWDLLKVK